MDTNLTPTTPAPTIHDVINDSATRDAWKALKASSVVLFGNYAAPAIAAAVGMPPLMIVPVVAAIAHAGLSFLGRKLNIDWL